MRGDRDQPSPVTPDLIDATTVVIFIHGYNNPKPKAEKSYSAHLRLLKSFDTAKGASPRIYWLYWPGDRPFPVPIASWKTPLGSVFYPEMVERARVCGRLLADFLDKHGAPNLRVQFVAHSLGNRLVLETIRALRSDRSTVAIDRVHMMAPAVPVQFCTAAEIFEPWSGDPAVTVSYSRYDNVLRDAFPLGEVEETGTPFSQAVGRFGNPPNRWIDIDESYLNHGQYWGDKDRAALTAYVLGRTATKPVGVRRLPNRSLPRRVLGWLRLLD